jgi:uncharacterized protein YecE (DUF72 family)
MQHRMMSVGTSGWHYRDWRGAFYPAPLPTRRWLEYYASQFCTVELNNTFYRLPTADAFRAWRDTVPSNFVFAVKASRYLTHYRRLRDPEEPVERLLGAIGGLGDKTGPVLLQLPPDLRADVAALERVFEAFAGRVRLACEFRHESWYTDDVYGLLRDRDVALCLTDRRNRQGPVVRTASWGFLRMHEGTAEPRPHYGPRALHSWIDRIADLWGRHAECFVYFNNDYRACAVRDAASFVRFARAAGLDVAEPADRDNSTGPVGGEGAR